MLGFSIDVPEGFQPMPPKASPPGVLHAYEGVGNVLRHYGMLPGDVKPIREPGSAPTRLVKADQLHYYQPCPRDGVWEPIVDLGAFVDAGQTIGRLHDFADHTAAALTIKAVQAGYVIMMHLSARPQKWQTLYVVAEEVPWEQMGV